jgi:hypothetical protein
MLVCSFVLRESDKLLCLDQGHCDDLDKRLEERRQAVELRAMKSTSRTIMATFVVAILAMVAYRAFFPGDAYSALQGGR